MLKGKKEIERIVSAELNGSFPPRIHVLTFVFLPAEVKVEIIYLIWEYTIYLFY